MTDLATTLDEAPLGRFHARSVATAGAGFFTDAYDLFVIGTATVLLARQWGLGPERAGLVDSITLASAFLGAFGFGRAADRFGRRRIYGLEALMMAVGAGASAFAPDLAVLLACRFVLGLGVGGDYPVSAVLMTEFANRANRGRLVGLVFATQALGTIAGYLAGIALLAAGVPDGITWRVLLGLGAVPAGAVLWQRRRMPESPRYLHEVAGQEEEASRLVAEHVGGPPRAVVGRDGRRSGPDRRARPGARRGAGLWSRRHLVVLAGTAGSWFLFDYAYYGNAISSPLIVSSVLGRAGAGSLLDVLVIELAVFALAAVPGYVLAVLTMDRIGHRRLQLVGFPLMGLSFLLIGVVPGVTAAVVPFAILFASSYFFAEFGPNTTTFVLPGEVFPTGVRASAHGCSAGVAKLGAFVGVYVFPILKAELGIAGALRLSAGFALAGAVATLLVPEPSRRPLEEAGEAVPRVLAPPRPRRSRGGPGWAVEDSNL